VAVGMAAIVFGYCHYFSFNYFLIATLMGAYMGAIWIWSGSLITPIVTHATYDFLALWFITRFKDEEAAS
jgi:membrane protease YdiL (CAAX protease family)